MIVVSDSTPLITLMKAAGIDLLHELFGEIVIPEAEEAFQNIRKAKRHISEQLINDALEIIHTTKQGKE